MCVICECFVVCVTKLCFKKVLETKGSSPSTYPKANWHQEGVQLTPASLVAC